MKNLSKEAVKQTAEELINDDGCTTVLDVKIALRAEGYFAKQGEVSALLFEIANEEGWVIEENGTYRTYSFKDNGGCCGSCSDGDDDDNNNYYCPPNHFDDEEEDHIPTGTPISHKDGVIVYVKEKTSASRKEGDWEVRDAFDNCPVFYFDPIYTRDEVRSAYAKLVEVDFVFTRARKFKISSLS